MSNLRSHHGLKTTYWSIGGKEISYWKNGVRHGECKRYNEHTGVLYKHCIYVNGKMVEDITFCLPPEEELIMLCLTHSFTLGAI